MGGLEKSIAEQELWSSLGYWVMVFGLIGDIAILTIPSHRARLEKILSAFFTLVIILGLAVEHRADSRISQLVSQQQVRFNLRIAQLNKEARVAKKAEAQANERVATLERETASLRENAEHEHLARLQIEAALAPRRLTKDQNRAITDACRSYAKPGVRVLIETLQGPSEILGIQLFNDLLKAGYSTQYQETNQLFYEVQFGGPPEHWGALLCLEPAIAKIGKMPILGVTRVLPRGSPITIYVGKKWLGALPK